MRARAASRYNGIEMNCPKDGSPLESVEIGPMGVDRCPNCGGSWSGIEELRLLKDREAAGDYSWIDFDLWKDRDKFRAHRQQRYQCPRDGEPMTTVYYGDSSVTVDICGECKGAWLDKEEFDETGVPGEDGHQPDRRRPPEGPPRGVRPDLHRPRRPDLGGRGLRSRALPPGEAVRGGAPEHRGLDPASLTGLPQAALLLTRRCQRR